VGENLGYTPCYGNQLQQVMHQECLDLLQHTAKLPVTSVVYAHKETLTECADAAREYNQDGDVRTASRVTDFCWALLDYGSAIVEGAALGVIGTVVDMAMRPMSTAASIVAGEWVFAYQLAKVTYTIVDLGITYCVDRSDAYEKLGEIIEPLSNIINGLKKGEISCRDALKGSVAFGVGWKAHGKLLGGLGKLYSGIKTRVIEFAKNNPLATPQEYIQTSDGSLFKASCKMMQSDTQKGKSAPSGGGPNTVNNTVNEIKEELGRARTWGEYFSSKVGQRFRNSFRSMQKQNPHDNSPLYEFIDKVNETEMFKKNRIFAPD
jgi:hypothetical protein